MKEAAFAYLEARLWPNRPRCPPLWWRRTRLSKIQWQKHPRVGVYKCYQCRKPFRVTVGTVF